MKRVANLTESGEIVSVVIYEDEYQPTETQREVDSSVGVGYVWDGTKFVAPQEPQPAREWTCAEFMAMIGDQTLFAAEVMAQADPSVALWLRKMVAYPIIHSDAPETAAGLSFAVAKGLISQSRMDEILSS
jgi:hypothetical protein